MPPLFSSDFFNHLFKNGGVVYVFIAKKWNAKKYMLSLVSVLQKSWRVTSVGERGGEGEEWRVGRGGLSSSRANFFVCRTWKIYRSAHIPRNLSCPEKFLAAGLKSVLMKWHFQKMNVFRYSLPGYMGVIFSLLMELRNHGGKLFLYPPQK